MYKTVRQGENSLQYTILPQTEEVLNSSGGKGKGTGRDYSPLPEPKTCCQKLTLQLLLHLYYITAVIFALLMIGGAVVALLMMTGIISFEPTSKPAKTEREIWVAQSSRLVATDPSEKSQSRKKELSQEVVVDPQKETTTHNAATLASETAFTLDGLSASSSSDSSPTALSSILRPSTSSPAPSTAKQEWIMPALKRLQSSTFTPPVTTEKPEPTTVKAVEKLSSLFPTHQRESNTDLMLGHDKINWTDYEDDDDEDYDLTKPPPTVTSNTKKSPLIINKSPVMKVKSTKQSSIQTTPTTPSVYTAIPAVNNTAALLDSINDKLFGKGKNKTKMYTTFMETKERILDDDDEDYEDDLPIQSVGSDDVKMSQTKSSWLQTRWPFVDPSSYFQWTDYSARDNLLLPAILSAAVSALLVLAVLCYALRRRQRCKKRIQEIGNLTSDLQAEDNAILLTADNPSEDD